MYIYLFDVTWILVQNGNSRKWFLAFLSLATQSSNQVLPNMHLMWHLLNFADIWVVLSINAAGWIPGAPYQTGATRHTTVSHVIQGTIWQRCAPAGSMGVANVSSKLYPGSASPTNLRIRISKLQAQALKSLLSLGIPLWTLTHLTYLLEFLLVFHQWRDAQSHQETWLKNSEFLCPESRNPKLHHPVSIKLY